MARPSDWSVLDLDKDPTPGDPGRVEILADRFLDFSEIAERAHRSVTSLQGDSAVMSWIGLSGDAFRENFGGFPNQLKKLYTSHQMVGDALTGYSPQLEHAQSQADKALADGREARSRLDSVTLQLTSAAADNKAAGSNADSLKNPDKNAPVPDPAQVAQAVRDAQAAQERQNTAQGAVDSAQAALDAAKDLAEQARALRTSAAKTCANQIDEGSDAGIQPRSFWQKLVEALKALWDIICEIAKWVALIAGVIAMIIGGPLAWIALAAGAILLIKAIVDFSQGKGNIVDLLIGIVGIIPGVKGLTSLAKLKDAFKAGVTGLKAGVAGAKAGAAGVKAIAAASLAAMKAFVQGMIKGIKAGYAAGASATLKKIVKDLKIKLGIQPKWPRGPEPTIGGPATSVDDIVATASVRYRPNGQMQNPVVGNYRGGNTFGNTDKSLPWKQSDGTAITYKEYDRNPIRARPNQNRGTDRFVVGSDGRFWATDDHYTTWTQFR